MRARNLKPSFFKNEYLAELPIAARYLFAGLWCLADREGRLEDRPGRIRGEVFPYENQNVSRLLEALAAQGKDGASFITRYEVNGNRYIQINSFLKHNHPHHREPSSIIPSIIVGNTEPQPSPGPAQGQPRESPNLARLNLESGALNDESPFPLPEAQGLDLVPPEFRTDKYRVVLATITVLEKLSGVTFTPDDRAAVATAHVGKSESQVAEALKRIAESYRAGTIRNLPRYAAEVISKQPHVRTERDAEEAKTIQRAQRLCADLAVPWKHYNAQAMAAVTQHNGAVKAAVEATWADHHAKLFTSDSPAVWWDRFTQHLDAPEVVS